MPLAPPQSEAPVRPASGKPAATAELFQVLWAALRTADTEWSPADLAVACANLQVRAYLYSTAGDAKKLEVLRATLAQLEEIQL